MIHTRLATPADAAEFVRLNALFNEITLPLDLAAKQLAQCAERVILAEVDGQPVGFACLLILQMVCYADLGAEVTELFVEQAQRGQGIGRMLLQHAERICRAAGATNITICTGFDNAPVQRLYGHFGFVEDDMRLRKSLG